MPTLQELLRKADFYKEKLRSAPSLTVEELKSLENFIRTEFICSSNALEEDCLKGEYKEDLGHGAAYDYMLELARQPRLDIAEDIFKDLHRLLFQNADTEQEEQYRTIQAHISGSEYLPPAPEDVPRLMNHLADQIYSSGTTLHPVELAAMAHKRMIDIYPFTEGSGKTSRLLMNLILVNGGYGVVRIPTVRRDDYFNALEASRRLNDMEPFSKLIAECVVDAERESCRLRFL